MTTLEELERRVNNLEKMMAGLSLLLAKEFQNPSRLFELMLNDYLETSGFFDRDPPADVRPPFRPPGE